MSTDHGSNNQSGDHTSRDHAGRDINVGMETGEAFGFILDYLWRADQVRERARTDHQHRLDRLTLFIGIVGALLAVQTVVLFGTLVFFASLLYPRLIAGGL